jgi:hypothetical protein
MNKLTREVQQVMPNSLDGCPLVAGGQPQSFEPRHQIKGELLDEQVGPVGMALLRGQFLQPQAALMLLNGVFHRRMLQVPNDNPTGRLPLLVGHRRMIFPIQLPRMSCPLFLRLFERSYFKLCCVEID